MNRHRKKALALFFFLVIGSLTTVATLLWRGAAMESQGVTRVDELSPRAQEFIASDSSKGTGVWSQARLKSTDTAGLHDQSPNISTPCFTIRLPWSVINKQVTQQEGKCIVRGRLVSPFGYVVMSSYYREEPMTDSGIVLRENDPKTYRSVSLSSLPATLDDARYYRSASAVTLFAWKDTTIFTFAITDIAEPDSITTTDITSLLNELLLQPAESPTPAPSSSAAANTNDLP